MQRGATLPKIADGVANIVMQQVPIALGVHTAPGSRGLYPGVAVMSSSVYGMGTSESGCLKTSGRCSAQHIILELRPQDMDTCRFCLLL